MNHVTRIIEVLPLANHADGSEAEHDCSQSSCAGSTEEQSGEVDIASDHVQQVTLREMLETVLGGGTLNDILAECLKKVLSLPWMSILPQGGIFLMEKDRQTLRMVVSQDLDPRIIILCAQVPVGTCHCGQAAANKEMQFSNCVDHRHEIRFPEMKDHGHYNVPLTSEGEVLGVLVLYLPHGFKRDPLKEQFLTSVANIMAGLVKRKRHEERLRLSDAVIKSTHGAVIITDLNRRILSVNPFFTEITGYTAEEALGQTPAMMQSGRHDKIFYQQMWKSILELGYWQGEIWNRRKNGEIYPEWLTISEVRDENGKVTNYVGVFSDISQAKRVEEELDRLAHYDALTDLPNRLLLLARLKHAIDQAHRGDHHLAVLFLDLDRFKDVNDSLGHPAGDELLQIVAKRLLSCLREVDTLARLGGDEFVVLLESLADVKDAAKIANKLSDVVKKPIKLTGGKEIFTSVSIGISIFPEDGRSADELIRNADTAMYQAKRNDRGTYHLYTEAMTRRIKQRLDLETKLRRAINQNELTVHYQPLVSISECRCKGVEALVRWNDPITGRLIGPDQFIPLAEETGLIYSLSDWVMGTAFRQMKVWQDSGLEIDTLAVNLSPVQFRQKDLGNFISKHLNEAGLHASCLELEITETAIMDEGHDAIVKLSELKDIGVRLAIDDFGTGYSSLAYLKDFPIDKLKIDKSFIRDVLNNTTASDLAALIIAMAKILRLESLAEGVENLEQLEFLKSRRCDSFQGYLFSRPLPAESLFTVLKNGKNHQVLDGCRQGKSYETQWKHLDLSEDAQIYSRSS